MKFTKTPFLILIALAALASFSGCGTQNSTGTYANAYNRANSGTNVLGIFESNPGSYEPIPKTTNVLHTSELMPRKATSGNNYKFLWGAFTIADY